MKRGRTRQNNSGRVLAFGAKKLTSAVLGRESKKENMKTPFEYKF